MASPSAKPAGSKPARSPSAASSTTAVIASQSKPNSGSKPNALLGSSLGPVNADMRRAMIAEAAYYIAEQRGFGDGREVEDWLLAESQIDARLSA